MPAIISGVVFNDLNSNGIFDGGEPGIPNASVVLEGPTPGTCISTVTAADGTYSFPNILVPGDYNIYETVLDPGAECPPTTFIQPTGFNNSTTRRQIQLTVTQANIDNNTNLDSNNFGHDNKTPFGCQSFAYQTAGPPAGDSDLLRIDLLTGDTTNLGPVQPPTPLNAIGYNSTDGNIWGIIVGTNNLFRLTPDNQVLSFGAVPSLPAPASNYNIGDVDANGYLYIYGQTDPRFFVVDVNPNRSTFGYAVDPSNSYQIDTAPFGILISVSLQLSDWSFNPNDGFIYSIRGDNGNVVRIDSLTGVVTGLTTNPNPNNINYGAQFFDSNNNLYGINNANGAVFQYAITGDTVIRSPFSTSVAALNNDGARCPVAPLGFASIELLKSAPDQSTIGSELLYTISVNNIGNTTANNVLLIDTIPIGTTFVSDSLTVDGNPIVGSPEPPGINIGDLGVGLHTVTFSVIADTIPVPNPVENTSSVEFEYIDGETVFEGSSNSNTVETVFIEGLPCDATGYLVTNGEYFTVDLITGEVTGPLPYSDPGIDLNAAGFNPLDGLVYGIDAGTRNLYTLGPNNEVTFVTNVGGLQAPVTPYLIGAIDTQGFYYLARTQVPFYYVIDLRPGPNQYQIIDPATGLPNGNSAIPFSNGNPLPSGDWTYDPVTDRLYAVRVSGGTVARVNPQTGEINNMIVTGVPNLPDGNYQAFSFLNGIMFFMDTTNGVIYRAAVNPNNLNEINFTVFSTFTPTIGGDGASCVGFNFEVDFGDAPDTSPGTGPNNYNTLLSSNGPRHLIVQGLTLGTTITGEQDAYQSPNATGDDILNPPVNIPDDALTTPLIDIQQSDSTYTLPVTATNNTANNAFLYAWIDFDKSGTFDGNEFYTSPAVIVAAVSGTAVYNITFTVPPGTTLGNTFVRLRLTSQVLINENATDSTLEDTRSLGPARDGEVEDYIVLIAPPDLICIDESIETNIDTSVSGTVAVSGGVPSLNYSLSTPPTNGTVVLDFNTGDYTYTPNTSYLGPDEFRVTVVDANGNICIATITVAVNAAILDVTLNPPLEYAQPGDIIEYTIDVTNNGNIDANNVFVTDILPSELTFAGGTNPVNAPLGTIAPGETKSITFQVQVQEPLNPNPIVHDATANYNYTPITGEAPIADVATSNEAQVIIANSDLDITKTVSDQFLGLNDTTTITLQIVNNGNVDVTNTTVTDVLAPYLNYVPGTLLVEGSPNPGNPESGVSIPIISVGDTITITFSVVVIELPPTNPIINIASVDGEYIVDPSLPPVPIEEDSNPVQINILQPNLESAGNFVKSVDNDSANIGDTITYTFNLINTGNTPAINPVINDSLSPSLSFVPGSIFIDGVNYPALTSDNIVIPFTLNPGEPHVVTLQAIVLDDNLDIIPNQGILNYQYIQNPTEPPIDVTTPSNTVNVPVINPDVEITKSVTDQFLGLNDITSVTLIVQNTGNLDIDNTTITDILAPYLDYVEGTLLIDGIPSTDNPENGILLGFLAVGENITIDFDAIVISLPPTNPTINIASLNGDYIIDPLLPPVPIEEDSNPVEINILEADLQAPGNFTKSADKDSSSVGEEILYTYNLLNTGNAPAINAVINDSLSTSLSFVSGSIFIDGVNYPALTPDNIVIPFPLNPNEPHIVTLRAIVLNDNLDIIPNQANLNYQYIQNPAEPPIDVNTLSNLVEVVIINPEIEIIKSVTDQFLGLNDTTSITLVVQNTGNIDATNVVVSDILAPYLSYVEGTLIVDGVDSPNNPETGITIALIPSKDSVTITFNAVAIDLPVVNPIENIANVRGQFIVDPSLPPVTIDEDSNPVQINILEPNLEDPGNLVKSVDKETANVGEEVTFGFTIINTGNTPAINAVINDPLSTSLAFVPGSIFIDGVNYQTLTPDNIIIPFPLNPNIVHNIEFRAIVVNDNLDLISNQGILNYQYIQDPNQPPIDVTTSSNMVDIAIINPEIEVLKTSSEEFLSIGDTTTITLVVQNTGNVDIENVLVTDVLSPYLDFIEGSLLIDGIETSGNPEDGITIDLLPAKSNIVISFTAVAIELPPVNPIVNIANLIGEYIVDPSLPPVPIEEDSNPVDISILQPDVEIFKSVDKTHAVVGEELTYSFTLLNNGNAPAINAVINDALANSLDFVEGSIFIDGINYPNLTPDNIEVPFPLLPGVSVNIEFKAIIINNNLDIIPNIGVLSYEYILDPNEAPIIVEGIESNTVETSVLAPDFSGNCFVKTQDMDCVVLDDILTYTFVITNSGNATAENVVLTDLVPPSTTFVANSVTINNVPQSGANPNLGITLPDIESCETVIVSFKVKITSPPTNNKVQNNGVLDYNFRPFPNDPTPIEGTAVSNTTSAEFINVVVTATKSADRKVTTLSDTITYTIEIFNCGTIPLTNIIVRDKLSKYLSFLPGSVEIDKTCSQNENIVNGIQIPCLSPLGKISISFKAMVLCNAPDFVENSADIQYSLCKVPCCESTIYCKETNKVSIPVKVPKLSLKKSSNKGLALVSDILTYTLLLANEGDLNVADVVLTDVLDSNLEYMDNLTINHMPSDQNPCEGIRIGELLAGEIAKISFDVKVTGGDCTKIIDNCASATYGYGISPGCFGKNDFKGCIKSNLLKTPVLCHPIITATKASSTKCIKPGTIYQYSVMIYNHSGFEATDVIIEDKLPENFEVIDVKVDNIPINNPILEKGVNIGDIPPHSNVEVLIKVKLLNASNLDCLFVNTVHIDAPFKLDIHDEPTIVSIEVCDNPGVKIFNPELLLVKCLSTEYISVGEVLTYNVVIENKGNVSLHDIVVKDNLASELQFVPCSVCVDYVQYECASIISGVHIGSLEPGATRLVSFKVLVLDKNPNVNTVSNAVNAVYKYDLCRSEGIEYGYATSNCVDVSISYHNINVEKSSDKSPTLLNDIITYTIKVTNDGELDASSVVVKDVFNNFVEFMHGTFTIDGTLVNIQSNDLVNGIDVGPLSPGDSKTLVFKVKVVNVIPGQNMPIINSAYADYIYILPNNATGTSTSNVSINSIPTSCNNKGFCR